MALLNGKNAVSLAALMAFGLATTPGGTLRLGHGQSLGVPAIGSAAAAPKKTTTKKKVAAKKPATTKRVCTAKKVKGKLVKSCKTVKIAPAPVVFVQTPVVEKAVGPVPVQTVAPTPAPVAPLPVPPPSPAPQAYQPRASDYFPIHLADSLAGAIGDAPPDFVVRFDRIDSWVWLSRSGEMLIVEPGRMGVVQYYFMPGGNAPYLVRDGYNSFVFDASAMTHVYDDRGRLFTGKLSWSQVDESRAMFDRGRALYAASLRQRGWSGDSAMRWYDSMRGSSGWSYQRGWRGNWSGDWRNRSDWNAFEYDQFSQMPPRYLDDERRRRQDSTWRYDRWRRDGAQGAPPPTANPVIQNPVPASPAEAGPPPVPAPAPAPRPRPPVVAPVPAPAPPPAPRPAWRQPTEPPRVSTEPGPNPPDFLRRRPAPQPVPAPPPAPPPAQVQVQQAPVVEAPPPPPPPPPPTPTPPAAPEVAPPPPPVVVAPPPPPPPPVPEPVLEQPVRPDAPVTVDDGSARQDPINEQRP